MINYLKGLAFPNAELSGFPGGKWYNYSILKGFPFFGSQGKKNICLRFFI
jgi:hypothetical protein